MTRSHYITQITHACEQAFDVPDGSVLSRNRSKTIVRARRAAFLVAWRLTGGNYSELGEWFGRDHKTAAVSVREGERLVVGDGEFEKRVGLAVLNLAIWKMVG